MSKKRNKLLEGPTSKSQLKSQNPQLYKHLKKIGKLDEYFNKETIDSIKIKVVKEKAKKYETLKEFIKEDRVAYFTAQRLGILPEITAHMERALQVWTKDTILSDARRHDRVVDWCRAKGNSYSAAKKFGKAFMEQCTSHMQSHHSKKVFQCKQTGELFNSVKKCSNKLKLPEDLIIKNLFKKIKSVHGLEFYWFEWDRESILKDSKNFSSMKEFEKKSNSAYKAATKLGLLAEVRQQMGVRRVDGRYTKGEVLRIALKYDTRDAFHLGDGGAAKAAVRMGIFEQACSHMKPKAEIISPDTIAKRAWECETRGEFATKYRSTYNKACKLGILDEVCSHMTKRAKNAKTKK